MATAEHATGGGVAAVIVVYGSPEERLRRCVDALVAAGGRELRAVVIVDNRAPHHEGVQRRVAAATPSAVLVRSAGNVGFSAAVNAGVAAAPPEADLVLLLNDDAIVGPGAVDALASALRGAPPSVVGGRPEDAPRRAPGDRRCRRHLRERAGRGHERGARAARHRPVRRARTVLRVCASAPPCCGAARSAPTVRSDPCGSARSCTTRTSSGAGGPGSPGTASSPHRPPSCTTRCRRRRGPTATTPSTSTSSATCCCARSAAPSPGSSVPCVLAGARPRHARRAAGPGRASGRARWPAHCWRCRASCGASRRPAAPRPARRRAAAPRDRAADLLRSGHLRNGRARGRDGRRPGPARGALTRRVLSRPPRRWRGGAAPTRRVRDRAGRPRALTCSQRPRSVTTPSVSCTTAGATSKRHASCHQS